jgi:hypothetical protein
MMMNKEEFIKHLKEGTDDTNIRYEVCQYFVNNYPVFIQEIIRTPVGNINTGNGMWTAIKDYDVRKDPVFNLEANFKKLQQRVDEIEKFK